MTTPPQTTQIAETTAIAALRHHLSAASAGELMQLARTCPDSAVQAAADRVGAAIERLRARLAETTSAAYRDAEQATELPSATETTASAPAAPEPETKTTPAPSRRRRTATHPAPAAPRTPRRIAQPATPIRRPLGNQSGLSAQLGDRAMLTSPVHPPTAQEAADVRGWCERMARDADEAAIFIDMLGVA
ncbi:hypothetical protein [Streptosporangium sp. NPDC000509]|uniref:hypothetical protein n=1 Tax=Streptosporangium sp. NPDC000509 TaxID=3366186 RepID=UPI0036B6910B